MPSAHRSHVAAGLKATLHNPRVSEEAKTNAMHRLEKMGMAPTENVSTNAEVKGAEDNAHVLGGYKATLHNERTSASAKKHAREVLLAAGFDTDADVPLEEHEKRVLAGYKAALANPNVSEEAKQHAEEYLRGHGELA